VNRTRVLTIAFLVGLVAVVVWLGSSVGRVECRVCMEFGGRRNCATAAAPTAAEAVQSARTTACGPIAGGVRDSIACGGATPAEQSCKGG
jgi:hypothetical protein